MKHKLKYMLLLSIIYTLIGCGSDEDSDIKISNPTNNTSKDSVTSTENDKVIPLTTLNIVTAPSPLYKAFKIDVDQSIEISNQADNYYAVELKNKGLYSFDFGSLNPNSTSLDKAWQVFDATGIQLKLSVGDYFRWTPPSTGTYYIRPGQGTVLKIKNHGIASSDPYLSHEHLTNGWWLFDSKILTTGLARNYESTSSLVTNLYNNEIYSITFSVSGSQGDISLKTISGEEIFSRPIHQSNKVITTISGLKSDTYTINYRSDKEAAGAKFAVVIDKLLDSDGDGEADETDPYPNDATKKSNNGSNNSSNGNNSSDDKIKACSSQKYTGDTSDPQFYTFDYIAQVALCSYRATQNTNYLSYGDQQCQVLDGLMRSTKNIFKPQYCLGSRLIR